MKTKKRRQKLQEEKLQRLLELLQLVEAATDKPAEDETRYK